MRGPHLTGDIVARMQRQLGLITRTALVDELDVPAGRVDWWLESGVLEPVHPTVYRRGEGYVPPAQPLLAAVLVCGPGAVAGARASVRLMGADRLRSTGVEVVIPSPRHLRPKPFRVVARMLRAEDRTWLGPIPAMTAERAVIDLAGSLPEPPLRAVVDDLRRLGRLDPGRLAARAAALATVPGARVVSRIVAEGQLAQENDGERGLARLLRRFHPQPSWQVDDLVPGRRLDACWVEALYALELDGRGHHLLPTDRDADGLRDLETTAGHVLVHRITTGMVRAQQDLLIREIRRTYERRLLEVAALADAGLLPSALVRRVGQAA